VGKISRFTAASVCIVAALMAENPLKICQLLNLHYFNVKSLQNNDNHQSEYQRENWQRIKNSITESGKKTKIVQCCMPRKAKKLKYRKRKVQNHT